MNTDLMFSRKTDDWATPRGVFDVLDAEFHFRIDAAANPANTQCPIWYAAAMRDDLERGGDGALTWDWYAHDGAGPYFLNPPYSRCRQFIAKAAAEARAGATVVCLVPSRTDTRWWHDHVWNAERNQPRPGVEIRFMKGRLRFGGATAGAPFPSVIVIFRPSGRRRRDDQPSAWELR
jgi:phage N-6-adenine-methyltransferase